MLYKFLNKTYTDEQLYVSLISDHGQAFLTSSTNPLSKARTNVPWLLKYPGSSQRKINQLTQKKKKQPKKKKNKNKKGKRYRLETRKKVKRSPSDIQITSN